MKDPKSQFQSIQIPIEELDSLVSPFHIKAQDPSEALYAIFKILEDTPERYLSYCFMATDEQVHWTHLDVGSKRGCLVDPGSADVQVNAAHDCESVVCAKRDSTADFES